MSAVVNPKGTLSLTYPTTAKDSNGNAVALQRSDIVAIEVAVDDGAPVEYAVTGTNPSDTFDIKAQLAGLSLGSHNVDAAVKTAEGVVGLFSAEFPIVEAGIPDAPTISLA